MSTNEDKRVALDSQHAESISTDREANVSSEPIKKKWWRYFLERGSVAQIITAAVVAVAIGLIISSQVEGSPKLRPAGKRLVPLLGELWLRALKAVGKQHSSIIQPSPPSRYSAGNATLRVC